MSNITPTYPVVKKGLAHIKYRPDIDGLRGIAVLSVVGFHASPLRITGGFIGVDIFFVISGFLISTIIYESLENGTFSFSEFYARRIRRIFPALIIVMTMCLLVGWFLLMAGEYRLLGKHSAAVAGFISNFIFWQESGYFDVASEAKPLLHLWSLAIEEQFYIFWPLLIYLAYNRKFNLLWLGIALAVGSFILNVSMVHEDPIQSYYSPVTRFWELLIGSILGYVSLKRVSLLAAIRKSFPISKGRIEGNSVSLIEPTSGFCNIQSFLGILLIGIAIFVVNKHREFPGWWALLPTVGTYLIISAGPKAWFNRIVLSHRTMVWFGLISYPLYLYHWPILSFLEIVELESPSREMRYGGVLVSTILAWLTYKWIEKPIRFGQYGGKIKVVGLCALIMIVGCIGYNTYTSDRNSFLHAEEKSFKILNYDFHEGKTAEEFWGDNGCLLSTKEFGEFEKRGCSDIEFPGRPVVFLIGDSHAAYLSLGIRSFLKVRQINLAQINSGWCIPLNIGDENKRCADINKYVLKQISQIKPDILIFFAFYLNQDLRIHGEKIAYEKFVTEELSKIKKLGVNKIILVGQIPTWTGSLPKVLARKFMGKSRPIPDRTFTGVDEVSLEWDKRLRAQNYGDDIMYVSLRDQLCNEEGCLTYVSNDQDKDLIVWDYGHLTSVGADYVTKNLLAPLLQFSSPIVQ